MITKKRRTYKWNLQRNNLKNLEKCSIYGFTPADYQREFTMNGETYKLTGINSRSKKTPCEITKNDGTVYKCGADLVYAKFEMQKEKRAK